MRKAKLWISSSRCKIDRNGPPLVWGLAGVVALLSGCGSDGVKTEGSPPELSTTTLAFAAIYGDELPPSQSILARASGNVVEVQTPPPKPDWLRVDLIGDGSSPNFDFSVNSTTLPEDHHEVPIKFVVYRQALPGTPREFVGSIEFPLTYDIRETISLLALDRPRFSFTQLGSMSDTKRVRLFGIRENWTVETSDPWLVVTPATGRGLVDLQLGLDAGAVPTTPGAYAATLKAWDSNHSASASLDVALAVEAVKFIAPATVALVSFPQDPLPSRTVRIGDSAGLGVPWFASSSAPWLAINPERGTSGTSAIIAADAAALGPGLHEATVTIMRDPNVAIAGLSSAQPDAASIVVTLEVLSTAPANVSVPVPANPDARGLHLATDPGKPYVYVANETSSLDIFDVYNGAKLASISVPSAKLGDMSIFPDGSQMFVASGPSSVTRIDLGTWSATGVLSGVANTTAFLPRLATFRCADRRLVAVGATSLHLFDADTLELLLRIDALAITNFLLPPLLASAGDRIYIGEQGISPPRLAQFKLLCGAGAPPAIELNSGISTDGLSGGLGSLALSPDGTTVCVASGIAMCFDSTSLKPTDPFVGGGNVVFSPSGWLYTSSLTTDASAYNLATGDSHSITFPAPLDGSALVISPDEKRLIARDQFGMLDFVNNSP